MATLMFTGSDVNIQGKNLSNVAFLCICVRVPCEITYSKVKCVGPIAVCKASPLEKKEEDEKE